MRTIETTATVTEEGTLTARVPPDISPGEHRVVLVIDGEAGGTGVSPPRVSLRLQVFKWEAWPADARFHREDLYGDDER